MDATNGDVGNAGNCIQVAEIDGDALILDDCDNEFHGTLHFCRCYLLRLNLRK